MSTPALFSDIAITAERDAVIINKASLILIDVDTLLENALPDDRKLDNGNYLFEQIRGKDSYLITRLIRAQDDNSYDWVDVE